DPPARAPLAGRADERRDELVCIGSSRLLERAAGLFPAGLELGGCGERAWVEQVEPAAGCHGADAVEELQEPEPGELVGGVLGQPQQRQEVLDVRRLQVRDAAVLDERDPPTSELELELELELEQGRCRRTTRSSTSGSAKCLPLSAMLSSSGT